MSDDPRAALERRAKEAADAWWGSKDPRPTMVQAVVAALLVPDARQHLLALLAPTPEEIGMTPYRWEAVTEDKEHVFGRRTYYRPLPYPAPTPEAT